MIRSAAWIALAVMLIAASPAHAHKLKVFATAIGARIDGSAYFVGGGPAQGAAIKVTTTGGEPLATTRSDQNGKFTLTAAHRVDHVIIVEAADGHSARFTLPAADLPASLPPAAAAAAAPPGNPPAVPAMPFDPPIAASAAGSNAGTAPLQDIVAQAVAQQIRPLREQINAYEEQTRLRDIVGGLGYILGIAGLTLWLRARRRERAGR